jgi:hypothetical protein
MTAWDCGGGGQFRRTADGGREGEGRDSFGVTKMFSD